MERKKAMERKNRDGKKERNRNVKMKRERQKI